MAHGKETPRQKMIGMMYLVLTALLALNVSTAVLDAFKIIDEGLEKTTKTLINKNNQVYYELHKADMLNPTKAGDWYSKSQEVKKRADYLYNYILDLKLKVLNAAERGKSKAIRPDKTIDRDKIEAITDYDTPNHIMIGGDLTSNSPATKLKNQIDDYRNFLLGVTPKLPAEFVTSINKSLDTNPVAKKGRKDDPEAKWEYHEFGHTPLMGFLAIMSSLQIDVRNAESEMINYLYSQIGAEDVKFNKLSAVVIPNSNYIIKNNEYNAQIFLAASDSTQNPTIWVADGKQPWTETIKPSGPTYGKRPGVTYTKIESVNGMGIYKHIGSAVGQRDWGGIIEIRNPNGDTIRRVFSAEYTVAEGSVVVSPTKMNVFYLGVDNPVKISVAGIPDNKIDADATNGKIVRQGNSWIMRAMRPGNSIVSVRAQLDGTKWSSVGSEEFRVKMVPDPIAMVNNQKGGGIQKNVLMAQSGVVAQMPPDFDFDLTFTVTEYTVLSVVQGFVREVHVKGAYFNDDVRNLINNLSKGSPVYIQDIKAVGPDGSVRDLSTINFRLI